MKHATKIRYSLPVSVVSLMLVVWIWQADRGNTSPGDLSAVHAQDPRLVGPENCSRCHGSAASEMAQSCLACHEEIASQFTARTGLHGRLADDTATHCETCHLEHHGAEFHLVDGRAFALAGIQTPAEFDHAGLDFDLTGRHLTIGCEGCHQNIRLDPLPPDHTRFLGLTDDCTSCHDDVHKGAYGTACASCHGQEHAFQAVAGFSHPDIFPLTGVHAEAKCAACHPDGILPPIDQLLGETQLSASATQTARTCADCHASPHRDSFLVRVSAAIGPDPGESCEQCHSTAHHSFSGRDATIDVALHALTGFPLTAPHDRVDCKSCHSDFGSPQQTAEAFRVSYPGRRADNCQSCHPDPHRGDFVAESLAGRTCVDCHQGTSFHLSVLTAENHAVTGFPLSVVHQQVSCDKCHPQTLAARNAAGESISVRHFAGTPASCRECHADPHVGDFLTRAFQGQDCTACHAENSFRPAQFTLAHHVQTGFPLSAAHQRVACEKCHPGTVTVRSAAGEAIRVHHFSGSLTSCRECHADPHLGQFRVGLFQDQDCTACHQENTFHPAQFTLAQHEHTRFPLTGAHEAVACRACHAEQISRLVDDRPVQARVFHGTPSDCRNCHADVHRGAFDSPGLPAEVDGRTDCLRCHTTDRFDVLAGETFDHELWTGYPLAGAHADVQCAQCHVRTREPDELGRTFGRARGRDCQTCHQDPHLGQFGAGEEVNCARCHSITDRLSSLTFDHQTDSRFKLDRTHARLNCNACHRTYNLENGGTVVRYKPLGTRCGDCHSAGTPRTRRVPSATDRGGAR